MQKTSLTLLAFLWTSYAAAQTQTVFINGGGLQSTQVTEKDVTFYKLRADDLKRVGAITAGGVTPTINAVKGCVGDTLCNGVYTVKLVSTDWDESRLGVTLHVANAGKNEIFNFMMFSPSDLKAANKAGNAFDMSNYKGSWLNSLLPGTNITVRTYTDNVIQKDFTRILLRSGTPQIKELQDKKFPLAKVHNMEWDLTCTKK